MTRPVAPHLDDIDRNLLHLLQEDADRSHVDLAASVGLSAAGVHKRLKNLHHNGYVKKVTAVRASIEDGTYTVNAEAIADKLLSNAQDLLDRSSR